MKLTSIRYSENTFNIGTLILRLGLGILMIHHGYDKLIHFSTYKAQFINFMGIGVSTSLYLDIFAEFFCSVLIIFGFLTRLAAIPLIITMAVAVWKAHNLDVFGQGEHATLFLAGFLTVLFLGPGKISVDGMIK